MASMMASAGFSDDFIKRQKRWHSKALLLYCRTGRAHRLTEQMNLSSRLAAK